MHRTAISARALITSAVLLLSAIGAHLLACGTLISTVPLFATAILIVLSVALIMRHQLSRTRSILLAIAVQIGTHYLLGSSHLSLISPICGGSHSYFVIPMSWTMNHWVMFIAHSVSAIVSYFLIQHSEKIWHLMSIEIFAPIQLMVILIVPKQKDLVSQTKIDVAKIKPMIQTFLTEASSRLSAPPFLLAR